MTSCNDPMAGLNVLGKPGELGSSVNTRSVPMKRTALIYTTVVVFVGLGILGILKLGSQVQPPVPSVQEVAALEKAASRANKDDFQQLRSAVEREAGALSPEKSKELLGAIGTLEAKY